MEDSIRTCQEFFIIDYPLILIGQNNGYIFDIFLLLLFTLYLLYLNNFV